MSVYQSDQAGRRGYVVPQRDESDRAFAGATRHSRHVRILRIAIPAAIGLCLLAVVGATFFNPFRFLYKLPGNLGTLVVSGTKVTMEQPRLAGFTRDARGYEVTARAAAQDLTKPHLVELKDIRARVDMQDKTEVQLTASNGLYDNKLETLVLDQNILLVSTSGYEGRLSEATVDIRHGTIVSDKPVEVKMLKGTLNANRLEVSKNGELVTFSGGIVMILNLNKDETAPADNAGTQ